MEVAQILEQEHHRRWAMALNQINQLSLYTTFQMELFFDTLSVTELIPKYILGFLNNVAV